MFTWNLLMSGKKLPQQAYAILKDVAERGKEFDLEKAPEKTDAVSQVHKTVVEN